MNTNICCNVNRTNWPKNCLLKYITTPFCYPPVYHRHQNMWQVPEMAKIIGDFGYNVDVINYDATIVSLTKQYDLLIDIFPQNNSVYQNHLKNNCIKVFYSTGASPTWQNSRQAERVEALNTRKHARMRTKCYVQPLPPTIAAFDALFLIGNSFTLSTFSDISFTKVFFIRNSAYQFPDADVSRKSANTFLYLATYPQVLKGLDLLLEVFSRSDDISLVVCSQFESEKDFCAVYEKELFHRPNILPVGVVDITSPIFNKIAQICSYFVLPSCSEGISGSVLTAMSAGLIPIVSRECGLESDDAFILNDCSIPGIRNTLKLFANKPLDWIKSQAVATQQTVRSKYTPQQFTASFRAAMQGLLEE